jgi:hypothetical protein
MAHSAKSAPGMRAKAILERRKAWRTMEEKTALRVQIALKWCAKKRTVE